jgi:hypothetical protein
LPSGMGENEKMNSVRESLRNTIELLSEEEARQVLEFVRYMKRSDIPLTLRRLAGDPTFRIPTGGLGTFPVVEPIQGKGVAASTLLLEDRR